MTLSPERIALIRRQAEAVLASGGGWNERTRAGLGGLAQVHGVPVEWVVALLSGADLPAPDGAGSAEVPGAGFRTGVDPVAAEAPGEATDLARDGGLGITAGLVVLLAALAVSVALGWFAFARGAPVPRTGGRAAAPAPAASAPEGPRGEAQADGGPTDTVQGPSPAAVPTRRVPPVPAIYPAPPGFVPDALPAWTDAALEAFAANERELASLAERAAAGGSVGAADREAWKRVAAVLAEAWPLLEDRRRDAAVAGLVRSLPALGDAQVRQELRAGLESRRTSRAVDPRVLWQGAGAAGILAVAERGGEDPARAFGEAALAWLGERSGGVAAAILRGDPAVASDVTVAWLRAVASAGSGGTPPALRDDRILGLMDALVRRGAPLDRPGTAADAAGTLVDAMSVVDRGRIAAAFAAWLLDPSLDPRVLHGLTSVVATRRPAPWWDPWLVSDLRADRAAREATADRYRAALAASGSPGESTAGRIRGAKADSVARWVRVSRAVLARPAAEGLPARIARVAQLLAALESLVLLERGRGAEAEARIAQLEDESALAPRENGRWRDGVEPQDVGRSLGADGRMEEDLRRLQSQDQRIEYLRRLRTRPMSDLGPLDAMVLAREAMAARSTVTRSVVQDVIADQYPHGPNVIAALAAEVPFAVETPEAIAIAQRLTGRAVPAGSSAERRAAAVLLLLDLHASLVPADRHRVDAMAREVTLAADAAAGALGGRSAGAAASPEAALREWYDAAAALAREVLPAAAVARIGTQAEARRRLASPGPRAAVAELVGILEIQVAVDAEQRPRSRSSAEAIARAAAESRRAAPDAVAQLDATARALLQLHLDRLAAKGGGA